MVGLWSGLIYMCFIVPFIKYISSTKSDFKDMPIQPSRVTKKGGTIFSNKGAQEVWLHKL